MLIRRTIPSIMATQHPDNASSLFWDLKGGGFVNTHKELDECMVCFRDLGADEFMWDWEGKHADEAVIDKLFTVHYNYFKSHPLGKKKFLTFRLPNIWKEKGYSLIRALMVILTSEDFAHDIKFYPQPLFEVILPMTEQADQLMYIQKSFQKLAQVTSEIFHHRPNTHADYLSIIPLIESIEVQANTGKLLTDYVKAHKKHFGKKPSYIRPFLAKSDPALVSGLVASVLGNKIALSDIYDFSVHQNIPVHPIIGVGSLVFRGGLSPDTVKDFVAEYGGVRTVTIQSAFRYDYPLAKVKRAIAYLSKQLPKTKAQAVVPGDRSTVLSAMQKTAHAYQETVEKILKDVNPFFRDVPKRRERRQHFGFLAYQRTMKKHVLPRAISFTAAFYSLGIPPEFLGLGRGLASLTSRERDVIFLYFKNIKTNLVEAGRFLNRGNLRKLIARNPAWKLIEQDIALTEKLLQITLGPASSKDLLHEKLTTRLYENRDNHSIVSDIITETGKLRQSIG